MTTPLPGPIVIGNKQASGLPRTWKPPCPWGDDHSALNVLERVNGCDESPAWQDALDDHEHEWDQDASFEAQAARFREEGWAPRGADPMFQPMQGLGTGGQQKSKSQQRREKEKARKEKGSGGG